MLGLMLFIIAAAVAAIAKEAPMSVHAVSMPLISGETISLSQYKGKVLLIVNTASRCGFTPQYKGLEELYQKYKEQGLVVLGFPANNFMGQEPGTNEEIQSFCELTYRTTFPLFAKSSVKGKDINPLFKYLTETKPFKGPVTWNFNKFLVDGDGQLIARFDSQTKPLDPKVITAVEKALGQE